MYIPAFVIEGNITITQVPDPSTTNLVYATIAIAMITAIGIGITSLLTRSSLIETRKSNELTLMEIVARIRPVLILENYGRGLDVKDDMVRFNTAIRNVGVVPANNIRIYNYAKQTEISLQDLISNENKNENIKERERNFGTLMQGMDRGYNSENGFNRDSGKWYLAIWIEFEFGDNKEEIIHIFNVRTDTKTIYAYGAPPEALLVRSFVDSEIKQGRADYGNLMSGKTGL